MSARYNLAPQAAIDLFEIWQYIKEQTSATTADRVESGIRERIVFLAGTPEAGHHRKDLTDKDVKFFSGLLLFDRLSAHDSASANRFHSSWTPGLGAAPQRPFVSGSAR
jgi:plasmid stabilization system protein ParE